MGIGFGSFAVLSGAWWPILFLVLLPIGIRVLGTVSGRLELRDRVGWVWPIVALAVAVPVAVMLRRLRLQSCRWRNERGACGPVMRDPRHSPEPPPSNARGSRRLLVRVHLPRQQPGRYPGVDSSPQRPGRRLVGVIVSSRTTGVDWWEGFPRRDHSAIPRLLTGTRARLAAAATAQRGGPAATASATASASASAYPRERGLIVRGPIRWWWAARHPPSLRAWTGPRASRSRSAGCPWSSCRSARSCSESRRIGGAGFDVFDAVDLVLDRAHRRLRAWSSTASLGDRARLARRAKRTQEALERTELQLAEAGLALPDARRARPGGRLHRHGRRRRLRRWTARLHEPPDRGDPRRPSPRSSSPTRSSGRA